MKKLYTLFLLSFFFIGINTTYAEVDFSWGGAVDYLNNGLSKELAFDSDGNIYKTGGFTGTVDFDPGAGTTEVTSNGTNNIYLTKFDSDGNLEWVKTWGISGSSDYPGGIEIDSNDNIYVISGFSSTVDFDPGAGTSNLTSAGNDDVAISVFDTDGNLSSVKHIASGSGYQGGHDIFIDSDDYIYVTGYMSSTTDFDPGAGTVSLTVNGGVGNDIFFVKYDSSFNVEWVKNIGNSSSAYEGGLAIASDSNDNVYVGGEFTGTVDFDPGSGSTEITSATSTLNAFLLSLDSDGDFRWVRTFTGGASNIRDLEVSSSDNIFIGGFFNGTMSVNIPNGSDSVSSFTSNGSADIFFGKFSSSGELSFVKQLGGTDTDYVLSLVIDSNESIILSGWYSSTVDFDPSSNTNSLTSAGSKDGYFAKYNSSGEYIYVESIGGSGGNDEVSLVNLSSDEQSMYISGYFTGTVDIDPTSGTSSKSAVAGQDGFIVKFLADTIPASFSFTDLTNQNTAEYLYTDNISVSGINTDTVDIKVSSCSSSSCEYSINSGSYTSSTGTVTSGDTVKLRQLSSSTNDNTTDFRIQIGDLFDTFSVSTEPTYQSTGTYFGSGGKVKNTKTEDETKTEIVKENEVKNTTNNKFTFTKNLTLGKKENEVLELQKFLNNNGFMVSDTGAGSKGFETNYFGTKTKNALIAFQKANNITPSVGFFGPITREKINSLINIIE